MNAETLLTSKLFTAVIGFPSSKDVSFAEVSCVDGNGMKQLRNKLKELIDK